MPSHRSRYRREPASRIVLQRRDVEILAALLLCRCLTVSMIRDAFFGPRGTSRCRRRLRQLYDCGFVERRFMDGGEAIYLLGPQSLLSVLRWCQEHGCEATAADIRAQMRLPALPLLGHALLVGRLFFAAEAELAARPDVDAVRWLFEALVRAEFSVRAAQTAPGRREPWRKVVFAPDAAIQFAVSGERRTVFLEADASTENARQLKAKFDAQRLMAASGQFAALYGEEEFVTVVVTTGTLAGRGRTIAECAAAAGASFVLATSFAEVDRAGLLGARALAPDGAETTLASTLGLEPEKGTIA